MQKRSRKFVQLEWECSACHARNPGPEQSCLSCGAPQPDDVEFVLPAEAKVVRDKEMLKRARAGADIYCAFCETRNPATATTCKQCGADLSEGTRRKAGGEVKRRVAKKTVLCSHCEAENNASNRVCVECGAPLAEKKSPHAAQAKNKSEPKRKWGLFAVLAVILLCIGGAIFFFAPSETVTGKVEQVHWQTMLPVQEEREEHHHDERGRPPADAYDVSCHTESEEVCTERTIDRGNGFAEVVEDCDTREEKYCSYTVQTWKTVETLTLSGDDYDPHYANASLSADQRLGKESAVYEVVFSVDGDLLTYETTSLKEYRSFKIGSNWTLELNRLGTIVSVER
jgi:hypothetical protein